MNVSDFLQIASSFFSNVLDVKNINADLQYQIKHFLRTYCDSLDLLPNAYMAYTLEQYTRRHYKRDMYNDFGDLMDKISVKSSILPKFKMPLFSTKFIENKSKQKILNNANLYQAMFNNLINYWEQRDKYDDSSTDKIDRLSHDALLLLTDNDLASNPIPEFEMCNFLELEGISKYPNSPLALLSEQAHSNHMISGCFSIKGVFDADYANKLNLIFNSPVLVDCVEYDQSNGFGNLPIPPDVTVAIACWTICYFAYYLPDMTDCNMFPILTNETRNCCLEDLWLTSALMLYLSNLKLDNNKRYLKLVNQIQKSINQ